MRQMVWNLKFFHLTTAVSVSVSVSKFLCPDNDTYIITTNQQVSLCQPKLAIKAGLPNQQLHPVVWTTCLAALLLSAFQAKRNDLLLAECHRGSARELCLAPTAQECRSLFPSCPCWVNDGPLSWKTWNTCPWTPRSYEERGLLLFAVTFWLSLIYGGMYPYAHAHSPLLLLSHNYAVRYKALLCAIKAGPT